MSISEVLTGWKTVNPVTHSWALFQRDVNLRTPADIIRRRILAVLVLGDGGSSHQGVGKIVYVELKRMAVWNSLIV